jgi:hypothetical protein
MDGAEIEQRLVELRQPGQAVGTQVHVVKMEFHGSSWNEMSGPVLKK